MSNIYQNGETHNQVTQIEKRASKRAQNESRKRGSRPASSSGSATAINIGRRDPVTGRTLRPAISGIDGPGTPGTYLSVLGRK